MTTISIDASTCNCKLFADVVLGQLVFNQPVYTAALKETKPVFQNVLSLHCIESNSSSNSSNITYNITASSSVPFMVNSSTGMVYLSAGLDYENQTSYTFTVACSHPVGPSASSTVEITVLPVNEFDPIAQLIGMSLNISSDATILVVHENDRSAGDIFISSTPGAGEVLLEASDNDAGLDGTLRFNLSVSGLPNGLESPFVINSTTGEVSFKQTLNGDVPGRNDTYIFFKVEIIACDLGEPNRCYTSNTVNVFLFLTDDNLPEFVQQSFTVSIPEDDTSTVGMAVVQATCIDDDSGPGELDSISIVNPSAQLEGLLSIPDPRTGNVVLKHVLDYEQNETINFMLRCQDTANNTDYANVTITVEPRNDNKPTFDNSEYRFNVSCETWNSQQPIGTVEATDEDTDIGNNLTYSIQNSDFFTIDSNGRIFLLPSIQNANGLFALTVSVSDGQFSNSVSVLLFLLCGPTSLYFVLPSQVLSRLDEHTPISTPIRKVTCNSAYSSSQFPVSYSFVSGNTEKTFSINSTSGVIVLARSLPAPTSKTFALVVQCSAGGSGSVDTTTVVVLVEDTLFDYQLPLICALGAVLVAFLVLGCIFVIVIAARKMSSNKKMRYVTQRYNSASVTIFKLQPPNNDRGR